MCHGFAGYFDAQLYEEVHLSIHPPTPTPNMFSWFPIYFPLRTPFYVPQGEHTCIRGADAVLCGGVNVRLVHLEQLLVTKPFPDA